MGRGRRAWRGWSVCCVCWGWRVDAVGVDVDVVDAEDEEGGKGLHGIIILRTGPEGRRSHIL